MLPADGVTELSDSDRGEQLSAASAHGRDRLSCATRKGARTRPRRATSARRHDYLLGIILELGDYIGDVLRLRVERDQRPLVLAQHIQHVVVLGDTRRMRHRVMRVVDAPRLEQNIVRAHLSAETVEPTALASITWTRLGVTRVPQRSLR